tara:strand:+ start:6997 stop:7212 length:216 start_codon:yes stop_codon:yes gene_type:complete
MSKQNKLAAWQSPAPIVSKAAAKIEPKVTKITEALEVKVPEPVVEVIPDPVVEVEEAKPEIKKLKKTKIEE